MKNLLYPEDVDQRLTGRLAAPNDSHRQRRLPYILCLTVPFGSTGRKMPSRFAYLVRGFRPKTAKEVPNE